MKEGGGGGGMDRLGWLREEYLTCVCVCGGGGGNLIHEILHLLNNEYTLQNRLENSL